MHNSILKFLPSKSLSQGISLNLFINFSFNSSETISDVTTKRDTEAFSKNDSETIEKKEAELSEISFKNLEKGLKKLEKQQQTQQNLIQQLEQELFSLDTHILI